MSEPGNEWAPETQPEFSGRPPRPPKRTARDLAEPGDPGNTVYLLDVMVVKDLADAMRLKPFQVVADLMEMKLFKVPTDTVNFETASKIARKHGFVPRKPPPGMLIL